MITSHNHLKTDVQKSARLQVDPWNINRNYVCLRIRCLVSDHKPCRFSPAVLGFPGLSCIGFVCAIDQLYHCAINGAIERRPRTGIVELVSQAARPQPQYTTTLSWHCLLVPRIPSFAYGSLRDTFSTLVSPSQLIFHTCPNSFKSRSTTATHSSGYLQTHISSYINTYI